MTVTKKDRKRKSKAGEFCVDFSLKACYIASVWHVFCTPLVWGVRCLDPLLRRRAPFSDGGAAASASVDELLYLKRFHPAPGQGIIKAFQRFLTRPLFFGSVGAAFRSPPSSLLSSSLPPLMYSTSTVASGGGGGGAAASSQASSSWPSMDGKLFTYYRDEFVNRVAFCSGNKAHRRHVVLIGGLGVRKEGPLRMTNQLDKCIR